MKQKPTTNVPCFPCLARLLSLTRLGLTACSNGFGSWVDSTDESKTCWKIETGSEDPRLSQDGNLTWRPADAADAAAVVAEVCLRSRAARPRVCAVCQRIGSTNNASGGVMMISCATCAFRVRVAP